MMKDAFQFDAIDVERLMDHMASDIELLREISRMFADYFPNHLAAIRQALEAGDCLGIRESAHQLKGAVSNFHATYAFDAVSKLEIAGRDKRLDAAKACFPILERELDRLNDQLIDLCKDG